MGDSIGEGALHAAGRRALATAIGIAISGAAFLLWPNPGERVGGESVDFLADQPNRGARPRRHRSRL